LRNAVFGGFDNSVAAGYAIFEKLLARLSAGGGVNSHDLMGELDLLRQIVMPFSAGRNKE
jgi:hypothetical protein